MKNLMVIIFLIFSSAFANAREKVIMISNVTVISPVAPFERKFGNVIIKNDEIVDVIYGSYTPATSPDLVIDGRGKFLTPGLIDSHVHLMGDAGLREDHAEQNPELYNAYMKQEPNSYLYFGFTTLIDLSLSDDKAKQWKSNTHSPDLFYCKRLNLAHGYGMAFMSEEKRFEDPYFIFNPGQEDSIPEGINLSEHTPGAVVAKVAASGAMCVKTFYEDGFAGLWDWPTPNDELVEHINNLANAEGLIHLHHGNTFSAYAQGAKTKIDIMAHGLWHWEDYNGYLDQHGELPTEMKSILDQMIRNGTKFQMTAEVLEGEIRVQDVDYLNNDPLIKHSLPSELIAWHNTDEGAWLRRVMQNRIKNNPKLAENIIGKKPSGKITEVSEIALARVAAIANYIISNGGTLLMGSDSPSSPTYANPPGLNGYLEMLALETMGIPREIIIQSATIANAQAFNIDHMYGSIEPSKKANMLLLNRNPLHDISAFNDFKIIFKDGQVIDRKELSAQLTNSD